MSVELTHLEKFEFPRPYPISYVDVKIWNIANGLLIVLITEPVNEAGEFCNGYAAAESMLEEVVNDIHEQLFHMEVDMFFYYIPDHEKPGYVAETLMKAGKKKARFSKPYRLHQISIAYNNNRLCYQGSKLSEQVYLEDLDCYIGNDVIVEPWHVEKGFKIPWEAEI